MLLPTALLLLLSSAANALTHGVDSSSLISTATYQKARSDGFVKVVRTIVKLLVTILAVV